jgi:hypothetical protein
MPPKKAKKAVTAAAKAKAKAAAADAKARKRPVASIPDVAGTCAPSPARPNRRDEELKAQRIIERKLRTYSATVVSTAVGKKSKQTVIDYVINELRSASNASGYLSSKCWSDFFVEFELRKYQFAGLPAQDPTLMPSDMLLEAVMPAHAENPAARSVEPFVQYMEYLQEPASTDELGGMLNMTVPGAVVTDKMSMKMIMAVLKHIGRFKLHLVHAAWWAAVDKDFDVTITDFWRSEQSVGVPRHSFLQTHKCATSCFLDGVSLGKVMDAIANDKDAPAESVKLLLASSLGAVLFAGEGMKTQFQDYIEAGKKAVQLVEFNDFTASEMAAFYMKMNAGARLLVGVGHKGYQKKESVIPFMGTEMLVQLGSIQDEWSFRLAARCIELAVSYGLLPRLPWEKVLWGPDGNLPHLPKHAKLPADLSVLEGSGNFRRALLAVFGNAEHLTFSEKRKIVAAK